MTLTLTEDELIEITHYKRPAEQLKALEAMGIPHRHRKHDNTVCVLRAHLATAGQAGGPGVGGAANDEPKLKPIRT